MKVIETGIADLKVIELNVHGDERGFFVERYNEAKFKEAGLPTYYAQDNHSRSAPGVLRGLHMQHTPPQGKLVGCIGGKIWDVAVDLRKDSPTFGQYYGLELTDANGKLFWIPEGFGHGFCVLGDQPADVLYKVTGFYNAAGEVGLAWDDPDIAITWQLDQMTLTDGKPTLSERDQNGISLEAYKAL